MFLPAARRPRLREHHAAEPPGRWVARDRAGEGSAGSGPGVRDCDLMAADSGTSLHEVVEIDLDQLDLRSALVGVAVLTVALVFVGVLGPAGMAAGIAALFVIAGSSGEGAESSAEHAMFIVAGAVVTLAVGYAADSTAAATAVVGLVAWASSLGALRGPVAAAHGAYLLMWAVLTLAIVDSEATVPTMAGAFVVGGLLALAGLWVADRLPAERPQRVAPVDPDRAGTQRVAVVRGAGAALCVALGFLWFPDHVSWAVLTFVLVLRPPRAAAIVTGVGRTLGTVAGVLVGMATAGLVGDSTLSLVVAFGLCAFAMLATTGVNYAVSTTFLTALLLLAQRLIQEDLFAAGWERLAATALGVVAAFAGIAVIHLATGPSDGR
jgi:hypothetical protein